MPNIERRSFLQRAAMLAVGGQALLRTRNLRAAMDEVNRSVANWPEMTYRTLGKTGFKGSRLVFGCGAALSKGQAVDLLEPAFEAGINVFDVGFSNYYDDAEKNLAPFLKKHRDDVFLISKAQPGLDLDPDDEVTPQMAKQAARNWSALLDQSLGELQQEHVDAYYLMASNNTGIVGSEEMYDAFLKAKQAGKVSHFGISTHENAENVLLTAAKTGWYSLAQIAITPAGWYDWKNRTILADSKPMLSLRSVLDTAREAGIGLIGMKAGRHLAGRRWLGWGNPDAYDEYYDKQVMASKLNHFQRSYAYVLANGLDAVNADMQAWQHLHDNVIAATQGQKYFASAGSTA